MYILRFTHICLHFDVFFQISLYSVFFGDTFDVFCSCIFVIGKNNRYLPYVGYVTLVMNDYPLFKYLLIGALGVVSVNREKQ